MADDDARLLEMAQIDLFFEAQGRQYTCRTDSDKSMDATDFVVGTSMKYKLDGNKAKLKSTEGKEVECKVVRVEASTSMAH